MKPGRKFASAFALVCAAGIASGCSNDAAVKAGAVEDPAAKDAVVKEEVVKDGAVCYSNAYSHGEGAPADFPQIGNTTLFYCVASTKPSTIQQLSQAGWNIVSVDDVPYSRAADDAGNVTLRTRTRLILQK